MRVVALRAALSASAAGIKGAASASPQAAAIEVISDQSNAVFETTATNAMAQQFVQRASDTVSATLVQQLRMSGGAAAAASQRRPLALGPTGPQPRPSGRGGEAADARRAQSRGCASGQDDHDDDQPGGSLRQVDRPRLLHAVCGRWGYGPHGARVRGDRRAPHLALPRCPLARSLARADSAGRRVRTLSGRLPRLPRVFHGLARGRTASPS